MEWIFKMVLNIKIFVKTLPIYNAHTLSTLKQGYRHLAMLCRSTKFGIEMVHEFGWHSCENHASTLAYVSALVVHNLYIQILWHSWHSTTLPPTPFPTPNESICALTIARISRLLAGSIYLTFNWCRQMTQFLCEYTVHSTLHKITKRKMLKRVQNKI